MGAADGVIGPGGEPELVEKEKKKRARVTLSLLGTLPTAARGCWSRLHAKEG